MNQGTADQHLIERFFGSHELYQLFFEKADEAIIIAEGTQIIDCNHSARSLLGFSDKNNLIGLSFPGLYPENNLAERITFNWEFEISGGKNVQFEVTSVPVILNQKQYNRLILQEKSEEKQLKKELHKTKEFLDGLIETIPQPVFAKDENFKYTYCNQAFCKYIGKPKHEIIGSTVYQVNNPAAAQLYHEADLSDIEKAGKHEHRASLVLNDGKEHHLIIYRNTLIDSNGEKIGITGSIEDVSLFEQNKKDLIASESKYKNIYESIKDVFYRTDINGFITEVSPSIRLYTEYSPEQLIGQNIEHFYLDLDDKTKLLNEIYSKGEVLDYEVRLKDHRGNVYWSSINSHLIYGPDNEIAGTEGSIRDITRRKKAESELKLTISTLQATLDSTTDGILVVNHNGEITSMNNQFKNIFGFPQDVINWKSDKELLDFVLDQIKKPEEFLEKISLLYQNPEAESFDTIDLKDGRKIERYSNVQRLDNIPIGRVWSFRDVTHRYKAEQQNQIMSHALKSINECISITDIHNNILFINEAFVKTYGYSAEELIGKNISMVRSPHNDPKIYQEIADYTTREGWTGELYNRRKDGTDFPILLSTTLVENDLNETIGMVGVAVDITERKKAESKLRESEKKYRTLIETLPDGVYRSTPEGKFVEVNPAMVRILGYDSIEELLQIDIKKDLYFTPEERERLVRGHKSELDVYPVKRKDGSEIWIEDHGWYIRNDKGEIIFHEGISRDVTERKQTELKLKKYSDELQELNATKDKFFSIIAHDLKSPFNSIIGLSEIIKEDARELDSETVSSYATIIHSMSVNTFRLLENLLDWAMIQQSAMSFKPDSILLKKLVNEVFELHSEKAANKQISINNLIPNSLIVFADSNMLKTVFRNLISNALKFTATKGLISVRAVRVPGHIEIAVKDSGTGISAQDLDKIFNAGTKFTKRGTENESGTGLGLLLCKEFIEKHGGKIWVESQEGKGSEFKFTIPDPE